jgi:hypothetical protein
MFAGWWISRKFGIEKAIIEYSAFIRSGMISKQQASAEIGRTDISQPIPRRVYAKLGITDAEKLLNYLKELVNNNPTYVDAKSFKEKWTESLIHHLRQELQSRSTPITVEEK